MIFEGLVAVYEYDRNLLAILLLEFWIAYNIDDANRKTETPLNTFDDMLCFVAQMTGRA